MYFDEVEAAGLLREHPGQWAIALEEVVEEFPPPAGGHPALKLDTTSLRNILSLARMTNRAMRIRRAHLDCWGPAGSFDATARIEDASHVSYVVLGTATVCRLFVRFNGAPKPEVSEQLAGWDAPWSAMVVGKSGLIGDLPRPVPLVVRKGSSWFTVYLMDTDESLSEYVECSNAATVRNLVKSINEELDGNAPMDYFARSDVRALVGS